MKPLRRLGSLLIALAAIAWSGSAAADIYSQALVPGTEYFTCSIVNLGKKPLAVTVEVIDADDGSTLASTAPTTLDPGKGTVRRFAASTDPQYCAFRGKISTKSVRASAGLSSSANLATTLLAPVQ